MCRLNNIGIAVVVLLLFSVDAAATDVRFAGSGQFQVRNSQTSVTIEFSEIRNFSSDTISGTLYLQLWASPDSAPAGSGFSLTEQENLSTFSGTDDGRLGPGDTFQNIRFTTEYSPPPAGEYYVYLLLFEYPNLGSIRDSVAVVGNPHQLGQSDSDDSSGGDDTGGNESTDGSGVLTGDSGLVSLICPCGFDTDGDFMDLEADRIVNNRSSSTGGLDLEIWFTEERYEGGEIEGYRVAQARLGSLSGQSELTFIRETVTFTLPPGGTYHSTMVLTEDRQNGEIVLDYSTFDDTVNVDDGGGGGGGAIRADVLALLLALLMIRTLDQRRSKRERH